MFELNFIYELLKGTLTEDGYKHFLRVVSYFIKKFNWPKNIVDASYTDNTKYWSLDEIKELTHQFFEWIIVKRKLNYLNKIPESYLSYYFSQMLISYVANKIKEGQQKEGMSFVKVSELVSQIVEENYIRRRINGVEYVFGTPFSDKSIDSAGRSEDNIAYIPKIPITESTKHFKPIVKMAVEDIFNAVAKPISLNKLINYAYSLFDQNTFVESILQNEVTQPVNVEVNNKSHIDAINSLLTDLTKEDAIVILEYVFESSGKMSLADISEKHGVPKSTLQYKIKGFKEKIVVAYSPLDEEDGLEFIKKLAFALDEYSK